MESAVLGKVNPFDHLAKHMGGTSAIVGPAESIRGGTDTLLPSAEDDSELDNELLKLGYPKSLIVSRLLGNWE